MFEEPWHNCNLDHLGRDLADDIDDDNFMIQTGAC